MADHRENFKNKKIAILIIAMSLWSLAIFCRLVQKQIIEHGKYAQRAVERQQGMREVQAPRGIIYDSRLNELAVNVTVSRVIAEPRRITDIPETAKKLAAVLKINSGELAARMSDPRRQGYLVVERRIDAAKEAAVVSLNLEGIYLEDETIRAYPNRELACHVLGFVNNLGEGGAGIERKYDRELRGMDGSYYFNRDAKRREYKVNVAIPPVQGNSLVLTIDKTIQHFADRALEEGVKAAKARGGTAIVMEVETGRLLALSNYPQFDGNQYTSYSAESWRNPAVTSPFEPGSTFKVAVVAAAIEAGVARPTDLIDCQNGTFNIAGNVFHDHNGYGLISVSRILEVSSNIGAAKLGIRLGQERLYESLRKFGFGARTGVDLPGEGVGILRDLSKWSKLSIGAISFGQEISVTSMQILTAINTIANDGIMVRPYVVERVIDAQGNRKDVHTPERTKILSRETAAAVADAMEGVILRGTAKRAALNGYRAAGKTGTAQKAEAGRYSKSKYVASFIGFAPQPQPKITVLVQLDEPRNGYYGGDVSAPIFQKISQETLMYLKVPPDPSIQPAPPPKRQPVAANDAMDFIPDATPLAPIMEMAKNHPDEELRAGVVTTHVRDETVVIPDFRGMSKRRVSELCMDMGIQPQFAGSGIAVTQNPLPGIRIARGEVCSVTFATDDTAAKKEGTTISRINSSFSAADRF